MKYAYEDLGHEQFEDLVVLICQELFGISVKGFATGPDGGRDAKFEGTAGIFPDTQSPWDGIVIIQAKHTNGFNRSFSDTDFFSPDSESTVIAKEIPRIKKLKELGDLTHYMLFSNRKLTGNADFEIKAHVSERCDIPKENIYIACIQQLEMWLKKYKNIVEVADIDPIDCPLIVSPDDLSEVVVALAKSKQKIEEATAIKVTDRIDYKAKNDLNNMSEDYAKTLRKRYLKDTNQIDEFLSNPENSEVKKYYEATVEEFEAKIITKRKQHQSFDDVMEYLLDLLFARDAVLRQRDNKRLTRAVLFYMYWKCDIGLEENAESE